MRLIFAPVTDVSANLIVVTAPSLIYSESNLPSTSPFALMRSMVTSFDESWSPILMIVSFDIDMPAPAKYMPVVSSAAIQVVPFHLSIWPVVAPMRLIFAPVTDVSANLIVVTAPSLIYKESNLPSTSPFALMRFLVIRLLVSTIDVLMIVSFEIAMPWPGK